MPASMNITAAKRDDARRFAAHAYRHGEVESHIDSSRSKNNLVLMGPASFVGARATINGIRQYQPTGEFDSLRREKHGRKIRTDANVVAQAIFTLPEELDADDLDTWCAATIKWANTEAPGRLAYAVLHLDEGRPHIHAGFIAEEEPAGKVNYQTTWGGPMQKAADRMRGLQAGYAAALVPLGVLVAEQKGTYDIKGPDAWRILKATSEAEARAAAAEKRAAAAEDRATEAEDAVVEAMILIDHQLPGPYAIPAPAPPRQADRVADEEPERHWGDGEKPQIKVAPAGPRHVVVPAWWYVQLRDHISALVLLREKLRTQFKHLFRPAPTDPVQQSIDNVRRLNDAAAESISDQAGTESVPETPATTNNDPIPPASPENVPEADSDADNVHIEAESEDQAPGLRL